MEEHVRQLLQAGALGVVLQSEVTETGPHVNQLQIQSLVLTARHVVTALVTIHSGYAKSSSIQDRAVFIALNKRALVIFCSMRPLVASGEKTKA